MALDILDVLGDKAGTSTKSIVGTLFGTSPDVLAAQIGQQNLANTQQTAMAYAQMDPMQRAQYAMFQGAAGGTGGLLQAVGAENPQITRAKQSAALQQQISQLPLDTIEGQKQAMDLALQAGRPEIAIQLRDVFLKQGKTQADIEKARRVDTSELVDQGLYEAAKRDAGGDPIKAAQLYNERRQAEKRSVAAAGVPAVGMVKPSDIATIASTVKENLKPFAASLDQIGNVKTYISQAKQGKAGAQAAVDQGILQIIGDNQVSKAEMQNLAASGSLPDRVANSVSKWATGRGTLSSLQEKEDLLSALEYRVGNRYNQVRSQQEELWNTAKLPKAAVNAAIGNPYVSSIEKKTKTEQPPQATQGGWKLIGVK